MSRRVCGIAGCERCIKEHEEAREAWRTCMFKKHEKGCKVPVCYECWLERTKK